MAFFSLLRVCVYLFLRRRRTYLSRINMSRKRGNRTFIMENAAEVEALMNAPRHKRTYNLILLLVSLYILLRYACGYREIFEPRYIV
jgi:hypothetical protein